VLTRGGFICGGVVQHCEKFVLCLGTKTSPDEVASEGWWFDLEVK
jgi:hypothetical protein